jgi:hypothetical protein
MNMVSHYPNKSDLQGGARTGGWWRERIYTGVVQVWERKSGGSLWN